MILLKAQISIEPGYRAQFVGHMQTLTRASLNEEGCLSFGCYEDVTAPNSFIVLAEWESRAALDLHEQSAHVAAFKASIGSMIASRRETLVYTVSHVGGLS